MAFRFVAVLAFLVVAFCSGAVRAEGVTLAYVEFPPYEFEQDGDAQGFLVDVVKEVFHRSQIDLTLVPMPFKRAYEQTRKGGIDGLFNFYKTEDRLAIFDYSEPIFDHPLVLFVRKDSTLKFEHLDDLRGKNIGVMTGYTYGSDFDSAPYFHRAPADSHISNLNKVLLKRIDAYACERAVCLDVIAREAFADKFRILPTPIKSFKGYIGFTKGKHEAVLKAINPVLERMQKTGRFDQIQKAYFAEHNIVPNGN